MADTDFQFFHHHQPVLSQCGLTLLASHGTAQKDGKWLFHLTFSCAEDVEVNAGAGCHIRRKIVVAGGVILGVISDQPNIVTLQVAGEDTQWPIGTEDQEFFAGLNVGLATQNMETVDTVLDWLTYHVATQGMQAALIVCREDLVENEGFLRKLRNRSKKIDGLQRLMLWSTDTPLGKANQPTEANPLTVRGAPGKDRLEPGKPDPKTSALGSLQIYQMLHLQYLTQARAVMNLDVHDLVVTDDKISVFDQAVASENGVITLRGQQCYPWRLKNNNEASFADHIFARFDHTYDLDRWCVAPGKTGEKAIWRIIRIVGPRVTDPPVHFCRFMALKHPHKKVANLVPKSSLVEDEKLIKISQDFFDHNAVRMPEASTEKMSKKSGTTIVTTMKNEGPFLLEWVAYHRAIGVENFLVYTNDCTDGTDTFLQLLQDKGVVQHRNNNFQGSGLKPQHHALRLAEQEKMVDKSEWLICMDVDEYINIKVGDGTLTALYDHIGPANLVAINWRLFGNADVHPFVDTPITTQFDHCAPEYCRKPHQAWGFKTLFKNNGIFKKIGVHRPKGLKPQLWDDIVWVNGSGAPIPKEMFRNAWRSTPETYGYDVVQLNHYAVRSAESFLVKRDRGRVNHVDRDQGLAYWFRMNNNAEHEGSIQRMVLAMQAEIDRLMADPEIAAAHNSAVAAHRAKIEELHARPDYAALYTTLTGSRLERLSRMHQHFGANVFLMGPDVIPDEVGTKEVDKDFFFTVEAGETAH